MTFYYYSQKNEQTFGPYSIEDIQQLIESHEIAKSDQICDEQEHWYEVKDFQEQYSTAHSGEDSEQYFHYKVSSDETMGPYSWSEIESLVKDRKIMRSDMLTDSSEVWKNAEDYDSLRWPSAKTKKKVKKSQLNQSNTIDNKSSLSKDKSKKKSNYKGLIITLLILSTSIGAFCYLYLNLEKDSKSEDLANMEEASHQEETVANIQDDEDFTDEVKSEDEEQKKVSLKSYVNLDKFQLVDFPIDISKPKGFNQEEIGEYYKYSQTAGSDNSLFVVLNRPKEMDMSHVHSLGVLLENLGETNLIANLKIHAKLDKQKKQLKYKAIIYPGEKLVVSSLIPRNRDQKKFSKLYGDMWGWPDGSVGHWNQVDIDTVSKVTLSMDSNTPIAVNMHKKFWVKLAEIDSTPTEALKRFPFIDNFGQ